MNSFLLQMDLHQKMVPVDDNKLIECKPTSGPTFGGGYDIYLSDYCNSNADSMTYFPTTYNLEGQGKYTRKQDSLTAFCGAKKGCKFRVIEYEVYQVLWKWLFIVVIFNIKRTAIVVRILLKIMILYNKIYEVISNLACADPHRLLFVSMYCISWSQPTEESSPWPGFRDFASTKCKTTAKGVTLPTLNCGTSTDPYTELKAIRFTVCGPSKFQTKATAHSTSASS